MSAHDVAACVEALLEGHFTEDASHALVRAAKKLRGEVVDPEDEASVEKRAFLRGFWHAYDACLGDDDAIISWCACGMCTPARRRRPSGEHGREAGDHDAGSPSLRPSPTASSSRGPCGSSPCSLGYTPQMGNGSIQGEASCLKRKEGLCLVAAWTGAGARKNRLATRPAGGGPPNVVAPGLVDSPWSSPHDDVAPSSRPCDAVRCLVRATNSPGAMHALPPDLRNSGVWPGTASPT